MLLGGVLPAPLCPELVSIEEWLGRGPFVSAVVFGVEVICLTGNVVECRRRINCTSIRWLWMRRSPHEAGHTGQNTPWIQVVILIPACGILLRCRELERRTKCKKGRFSSMCFWCTRTKGHNHLQYLPSA